MLLRHSFHLDREATCVESAVGSALAAGCRTTDLARGGQQALSTSEMGKRVAEAAQELAGVESAKSASQSPLNRTQRD
jgi:3-isopropylmalate dehydrogenase